MTLNWRIRRSTGAIVCERLGWLDWRATLWLSERGNLELVRAILDAMCRPIASGFVCGAVGGEGVARIFLSGLPGEAWTAPSPVQ